MFGELDNSKKQSHNLTCQLADYRLQQLLIPMFTRHERNGALDTWSMLHCKKCHAHSALIPVMLCAQHAHVVVKHVCYHYAANNIMSKLPVWSVTTTRSSHERESYGIHGLLDKYVLLADWPCNALALYQWRQWHVLYFANTISAYFRCKTLATCCSAALWLSRRLLWVIW